MNRKKLFNTARFTNYNVNSGTVKWYNLNLKNSVISVYFFFCWNLRNHGDILPFNQANHPQCSIQKNNPWISIH